MYTDLFISHTQRWITDFVIQLDLCPYAKQCIDDLAIRYVVSTAEDAPQLLLQLQQHSEGLAEHTDVSHDHHDATLLIHPYMPGSFVDQLDLQQHCRKFYQPVADVTHLWFHPDYQTSNSVDNTPGNNIAFINRAPYPTILLYKSSAILDKPSSTQQAHIHTNNVARISKLDFNALNTLLIQCSARKVSTPP